MAAVAGPQGEWTRADQSPATTIGDARRCRSPYQNVQGKRRKGNELREGGWTHENPTGVVSQLVPKRRRPLSDRLPWQALRVPWQGLMYRVERPRGQNRQGQNRGGPKRSVAGALRACALGIGTTEAQTRPRRQERINALPRPPTSRHDQQPLPGQDRQGFAEWQNPYGRQVHRTIE